MESININELMDSFLTYGITFEEMLSAITRLSENAIKAETLTDALLKALSTIDCVEQKITEQNRPETSEKTESPNQKMDLEIFEPNVGHIDFIEFEDNPFCDGIIFTEE
jgi:hypothetical protein